MIKTRTLILSSLKKEMNIYQRNGMANFLTTTWIQLNVEPEKGTHLSLIAVTPLSYV